MGGSRALSFCMWLVLLNMVISSSVHFPKKYHISLFLMTVYNCIMYTCHIFFIHLSTDRFLGWFHFLAAVNRPAVNMDIQLSL